MGILSKGMQQYQAVFTILTVNGNGIPADALLENEEIKRTVQAVLAAVSDLRVVNAVIDLTHAGRSRSDVPAHINNAIETLFLTRAKDIINGTATTKQLAKTDKQIDSYAKKEVGCRNHLKSDINVRINELNR